MDRVVLHGITLAAGGSAAQLPAPPGVALQGASRPLVGPFGHALAEIDAPEEAGSEARRGLPPGPAQPEAVAVRLRRLGLSCEWGGARALPDGSALARLSRERGRSSIEMIRADPSLVSEMQVGSWFNASWRGRLLKRAAVALDALIPYGALRGPTAAELAADVSFWAGVKSAATSAEWRRLTRASYVGLLYHRMAGDSKHGQERMDIRPERFLAHVRLLRRLRFHYLDRDRLLAFHAGDLETLPPRSVAVSVDDGFRDCLEPVKRAVEARPQLFVPTGELGGRAHWAAGEPLATWHELRALASSGVAIGAHARAHRPLTSLADEELRAELAGSLADLRRELPAPSPIVSYPNGRHDERVRDAARAAGFAAAYTTEKGRNGVGLDRYCLRRVSIHASDGRLALLWKAMTGEALPRSWEALRRMRRRTR